MLTKNQIIKQLELHKKEIRTFGVKKLFLIGSYARDEATARSDIDFLVEFKAKRGLFDDYQGLREFLQSCFGKEVDLVKPALIREELKEYILGGDKLEARV